MPISEKSANSPPEQFYTTAPKDYDWGWTTVLVENAGKDGRGKTLRLVEISDGYHADYQTGRYASGNHVSLTPAEFKKQVGLGLIQETPEAEQIVALTRDFDLEDVVTDDAKRKKVAIYFHFKDEPVDGITVSFKPKSGGLVYTLRVHGPRAAIQEKFDTIASKIEAALKGD